MKISLNLWRWCAIALGLLLAVAVGYGLLMARRAKELDLEVARQRSELLAEQARADGWEVVWAEAVPDLLAEAAQHDSTIARLRKQIQLAGAQAVASARLEATAALDTVLVTDTVLAAHVQRWEFDLPPFTGRAEYRPPNALALSIRARIHARLVGTITPDKRLLVTAKTRDPGVTLDVLDFVWTPPEIEPPGFAWLCAGVGFGSGVTVALRPEWWTAGAGALATWIAC